MGNEICDEKCQKLLDEHNKDPFDKMLDQAKENMEILKKISDEQIQSSLDFFSEDSRQILVKEIKNKGGKDG
jgi:dsDNA-binding SOS-regulon protein